MLMKNHRKRNFQIPVLRKHASFRKMKMILCNRRGMLIVLSWDKNKICICGYIRVMKNMLFWECYHYLAMCQDPAPEVDVIWNIQQNLKKKQQKAHRSRPFLHRFVNRQPGGVFFIFPVDEREIGSHHFLSKRPASPGIFPWLVFYQNWYLQVLVLFPSFRFSLLSSVAFALSAS